MANHPTSSRDLLTRSGAVSYAVWGLLHVGLGISMLIPALTRNGPSSELEAESAMFFICATVLGLLSIGIALSLNWHNSRIGYWLNALLVLPVDIALLLILIGPGHIDVAGGLVGPAVMVVALVLTSLARRQDRPLATAMP